MICWSRLIDCFAAQAWVPIFFRGCDELAPEAKRMATLGSISVTKTTKCSPANTSGMRSKSRLRRLNRASQPNIEPFAQAVAPLERLLVNQGKAGRDEVPFFVTHIAGMGLSGHPRKLGTTQKKSALGSQNPPALGERSVYCASQKNLYP